jgi:hypothetical protein
VVIIVDIKELNLQRFSNVYMHDISRKKNLLLEVWEAVLFNILSSLRKGKLMLLYPCICVYVIFPNNILKISELEKSQQ